jgi:hypothetical protein
LTAPLIRTLEANTVGCAAATDQVTIIGRAPYAGTVTGVYYIPSASVTGLTLATASRTYTVTNRGSSAVSGTGTVSVATLINAVSGAGFNLLDNVPSDFTLATTANLAVVSGDVLELQSVHTTTGVADPGGKIVVTFSRS